MARVRIGPLSYGPKGRRGIHAGPFRASYNVHNPAFGAFMLLVVVVAIVSKIWPILLVLALVFAVAWPMGKQKREEQATAAKQRRQEEVQRWLSGPPPTLMVPQRFSEQWFAANVPRLHPKQVPTLFAELHARGWTGQRIQQRLGRYLAANPFYEHRVDPPPRPQPVPPAQSTTHVQWRGLHGGTGEAYVGAHVVDPSGKAGQVEQVLAPGRVFVRWEDGTTSVGNPG